jgi:hypothetical protein
VIVVAPRKTIPPVNAKGGNVHKYPYGLCSAPEVNSSYATSREVAGSIPNEDIGFFN